MLDASARAPAAPDRGGSLRRGQGPWTSRWKRRVSPYLYILPTLIGIAVFTVYPLASSLYHAFTNWTGLGAAKWIGLGNFRYLFTQDPTFWPSLRATGYFVLLGVPSGIILGLALAVLVNRAFTGVRIFRTIFYLPVVLPSIAVLTLWQYIFDPAYGLANQILHALGLPTSQWLNSSTMAMPSIVIIGLWGVGGSMIIFLAALQNVPTEIYEAARVDGASAPRVFFSITLPMITPLLLLELILGLTLSFQAFNQIAVLTKGGPNQATNLFMYKIYTDAFGGYSQLGLASAEAWILFLIIMAVTIAVFRSSRMWVFSDGQG